MEPYLVSILNLVNSHPEQHALFVRLFSLVADGEIKTPDYLPPFCMRKLKYIEIKEKLLQELNGNRDTVHFARKMNFIFDVLHAFDDTVWQDAEMWPYYAH